MGSRFLPGREALQSPAIYQKNIQPAVVVVVIKSDTATGCLQQVLVLVFAAVNGFCVEPGLARNVNKTQSQASYFRGFFFWKIPGLREKRS
jgi:hypothetical protein